MLCGLYAVINGIRLAATNEQPIARKQCRRLLKQGLRHLEGQGYDSTPYYGMDSDVWAGLAKHLLKYAAEKGVAQLRRKGAVIELAADAAANVHRVERLVARGVPVAIWLQRALDHYSVVVGFNDERWMLFDSKDHRWVGKDLIGTADSAARHVLGPHAVMFVPE
jgi:hypothetical protein